MLIDSAVIESARPFIIEMAQSGMRANEAKGKVALMSLQWLIAQGRKRPPEVFEKLMEAQFDLVDIIYKELVH